MGFGHQLFLNKKLLWSDWWVLLVLRFCLESSLWFNLVYLLGLEMDWRFLHVSLIGFFALLHLNLFIPFAIFHKLMELLWILLFFLLGVNCIFIKVWSGSSALRRVLREREDAFEAFLDWASCDRLEVLSVLLYPLIEVHLRVFIGMIGLEHCDAAVSGFLGDGFESTELKSVWFVGIGLKVLV